MKLNITIFFLKNKILKNLLTPVWSLGIISRPSSSLSTISVTVAISEICCLAGEEDETGEYDWNECCGERIWDNDSWCCCCCWREASWAAREIVGVEIEDGLVEEELVEGIAVWLFAVRLLIGRLLWMARMCVLSDDFWVYFLWQIVHWKLIICFCLLLGIFTWKGLSLLSRLGSFAFSLWTVLMCVFREDFCV